MNTIPVRTEDDTKNGVYRADRNLWLTIRRALVMIIRAIEFRYGIDAREHD